MTPASVEHTALLRTVVSDPRDNTARLVFADWFEENGEPKRAEFIRLQVELAKWPALPDERPFFRADQTEDVKRQVEDAMDSGAGAMWRKVQDLWTRGGGLSSDPRRC
jgi:uncharacterized protein (TIGR02996 family)